MRLKCELYVSQIFFFSIISRCSKQKTVSPMGFDIRDVDTPVLQFLLLSPFHRNKSSIREEDSSARAGEDVRDVLASFH